MSIPKKHLPRQHSRVSCAVVNTASITDQSIQPGKRSLCSLASKDHRQMAFVAASEECLKLSGSKAVTLLAGSDDTTFTFDHVAGPSTTQEQFFRGTNSLS